MYVSSLSKMAPSVSCSSWVPFDLPSMPFSVPTALNLLVFLVPPLRGLPGQNPAWAPYLMLAQSRTSCQNLCFCCTWTLQSLHRARHVTMSLQHLHLNCRYCSQAGDWPLPNLLCLCSWASGASTGPFWASHGTLVTTELSCAFCTFGSAVFQYMKCVRGLSLNLYTDPGTSFQGSWACEPTWDFCVTVSGWPPEGSGPLCLSLSFDCFGLRLCFKVLSCWHILVSFLCALIFCHFGLFLDLVLWY